MTAEAIGQCMATLQRTKRVKGVERDKTEAELRHEARTKALNRLACKAAPRYSLYALRHTWATNALKRGVDPLAGYDASVWFDADRRVNSTGAETVNRGNFTTTSHNLGLDGLFARVLLLH